MLWFRKSVCKPFSGYDRGELLRWCRSATLGACKSTVAGYFLYACALHARFGGDPMLSRRKTVEEDLKTFRKMRPLLKDLWHASRLLADIELVWPELSDTEREDIMQSRTRRDEFHEKVAEEKVAELLEISRGIQSFKYRKIREEVQRHLKNWDSREPDQIKIFAAKMTAEINS